MNFPKILGLAVLLAFAVLQGYSQIPNSKPSPASVLNSAPTLGPVIRMYYDAIKRRDNVALRKTLSAEFLLNIEEDMRNNGQKNLAAFLAKTEYQTPKIEIRNEKLSDDKGVADVRGSYYQTWTPIFFVKENGHWKLGTQEMELQDTVKQ